jgi:hypothetical protein
MMYRSLSVAHKSGAERPVSSSKQESAGTEHEVSAVGPLEAQTCMAVNPGLYSGDPIQTVCCVACMLESLLLLVLLSALQAVSDSGKPHTHSSACDHGHLRLPGYVSVEHVTQISICVLLNMRQRHLSCPAELSGKCLSRMCCD